MSRRVLSLLLAVLALPALSSDPPRKKIERADQLPARAYPVAMKPSALIQDPKATGVLAAAIRKADPSWRHVVATAVQLHAFSGWSFIGDVRRNKGYQYALMQEVEAPETAKRSAFRRKCAALLTALQSDWRNLTRLFPFYCRWYDLPLALAMLVANRVLEWPGATDALRDLERPAKTAFR
jgi:hypothetical protein